MAESERQPALPASRDGASEELTPAAAPLAHFGPAGRRVALAAGHRLFARPPRFLRGVVRMDDLPPPHPLEVALAGRSNVGKSSLINALFNRRDVARTSNTPGRTRELNYFRLADERLALVDMPGYGYAKAPKSHVRRWQALVRDFLRGRVPLRRVLLLVDARHGLKRGDLEAMDLLDAAAVTYQLVVTKADKVRPGHLHQLLADLRERLHRRPAAHPAIHVTSARKGVGIDLLRAEIALLLPDVAAAASAVDEEEAATTTGADIADENDGAAPVGDGEGG